VVFSVDPFPRIGSEAPPGGSGASGPPRADRTA
jgi:hypothetical protein